MKRLTRLSRKTAAIIKFIRRGMDLVYRDTVAHLVAWVLPARVMSMYKYFHLWEHRGYHVLPVHFYTPIPQTTDLTQEVLRYRSEMVGVDLQSDNQISLIRHFGSAYKQVYEKFPLEKTDIDHQYYCNNPYLSPLDAIVLYSMIRHYQATHIIEVGSGYSTYISAQAVRDNRSDGVETHLTAIEPYPNAVLRSGFDGLSQLINTPVQKVPLSLFQGLASGDILFIDSTHVLKTGSDVQWLYLEVLPRLQSGVIVHVHDIFLPYEYPEEWLLNDHRFWNEQYLLQAFLAGRNDFEVLFASHYMSHDYPEILQEAWGIQIAVSVEKTLPFVRSNSLWFRRKFNSNVD